jgi:transglutaminase-like putative cysteine protease
MSGDGGAAPVRPDEPVLTRLRGLLSAPALGWSTLLAVAVMFLAVSVAIDQSAWAGSVAGSRTSQTAFLPVCTLLATLVGYLLGRSRMRTLFAHAVGATLGAGYLLVAVSGTISHLPALELRLRALSDSVGTYVNDVMVRDIRSAETSVFLLLIGALLWAAAQLGAFALFRRQRAGPAITLAATALLLNMSITVEDELVELVVLVAAGLLLVVRTSLFSQLEQWRSRRIADTSYATQLFVRSGVTFVSVAVVLSLVLATYASSAPLRPMWDQALDKLIAVGIELNHFMGGVTGEAKGPSLLFTPSQTIRDVWETSSEPVFTVITADGLGYRWRGATYELFDGRSWQHVVDTQTAVPAFEDLQAPTADAGLTAGRHEVVTEVTAVAMNSQVIVAPDDPVRLDGDATVETNAVRALLDVKLNAQITQGSSYVVTARVFDSSGPNALTATDLASAGVQYGPGLAPYVDIEPGSIGAVTKATADNIVGKLDPRERDPYHIALAMQNFLYSGGGFVYQTDVRGMCTGQNLVDCFLQQRRGYCEYFATALTMMLRAERIPARYVVGYLPGLPQDDGSRLVERSMSHAWVEVYFPGYGWYPFDPTPGLGDFGQQPTELPVGSAKPTNQPGQTLPEPNFGQSPGAEQNQLPPPPSGSDNSGGPLSSALAMAIFVGVLLVAGLLVLFARRRRLPGGGRTTYDSVTRMAARLGYAPLPSQTAYEYADRLAVVVPAVRDELHVVATAKVEAIYARREPSPLLKLRLLQAYRRVRMSLLRLMLRRPGWLAPRWRRR